MIALDHKDEDTELVFDFWFPESNNDDDDDPKPPWCLLWLPLLPLELLRLAVEEKPAMEHGVTFRKTAASLDRQEVTKRGADRLRLACNAKLKALVLSFSLKIPVDVWFVDEVIVPDVPITLARLVGGGTSIELLDDIKEDCLLDDWLRLRINPSWKKSQKKEI